MKKSILALVGGFLLSPVLALGQAFTTVTATGVTVDNGSGSPINPPSGSTLCFLGVNNAGAAITYTPLGGGPVTGPVCQTLNSSGNLTGSLQIANPATASPSGLLYTISVANGSTTYLTIPQTQLSGTLFQFNTYSLPVNGHALGIGFPHLACNAGATWTSTTLPTGQDSFTCTQVAGSGQWKQYPSGGNYCPTGMGYLTPQGDPSGKGFCIPPVLAGIGPPSGSCVKNSTYYQQDLPGTAYACVADVWQPVAGGGIAGLTSFNGRSTAGATLQVPDVQSVMANSPFSMSGSMGIGVDSAAGTISPSTNWFQGTGGDAGKLIGIKDLNIRSTVGGSNLASISATDGSALFGGGTFSISAAGVAGMASGSTAGGSPICTTANGACPTGGAAFYQTAQNNASSLTARSKLNFITASGITGADDSGNASTNLSLSAVPNSSLANSSITINCSGSCSGGGSVALGGSTTITVTGGGGGTPGGTNEDNQINIAGAFGVDTGIYTYNNTTHTLNYANVGISGAVNQSVTNPNGGIGTHLQNIYNDSTVINRIDTANGIQFGTPAQFSGIGWNQGSFPNLFGSPSPWTTDKLYAENVLYQRPGITQVHSTIMTKLAEGDSTWMRCDNCFWSGEQEPGFSDEQQTLFDAVYGEVQNIYSGNVATSAGTTILGTTFNEAGAGTPLAGTTPATCTSGCAGPWTLASGPDGTYQSGGGVLFTAPGTALDLIDTGNVNESIKFTVPSIGTSSDGQIVVRFANTSNLIVVEVCNGSSTCGGIVGISVLDVVAGSISTLGSENGTPTGNYTVVLNGNQITITGPGGTIGPFTTGNTTGTKFGMNLGAGSSFEVGSLQALSPSIPGATTVPITNGGNEAQGGDVADTVGAITGGYFRGPVFPVGLRYNAVTVGGTALTPSAAYADLTCPNTLSPETVPGTLMTAVCTATNILGTNAGGFTTGTATLGGYFGSQVNITAVGTISGTSQPGITFQYRVPNLTFWVANTAYSVGQVIIDSNGFIETVFASGTSAATHPAWPPTGTVHDGTNGLIWTNGGANTTLTATMWQGGLQGYLVCQDYWQSSAGALPVCNEAWGATNSTTLVINGGGNPQTNYQQRALTSLTQSGTTVTATIDPSDPEIGFLQNQTTAAILDCSASTLNGTITGLTLINLTQVQWTSSTSGTATCSTATLTYDVNAAHGVINYTLFPYARSTDIDETHATMHVEPNRVNWTTGDPLFQPHGPTFHSVGIGGVYSGLHPGNGSNSDQFIQVEGLGAAIAGGYHFFRAINSNPSSMYFPSPGAILHAPLSPIGVEGPNNGTLSSTLPIEQINAAINLGCLPGLTCAGDNTVLNVLGTGKLAYNAGSNAFKFNGNAQAAGSFISTSLILINQFDALGIWPETQIIQDRDNTLWFCATGCQQGSTSLLSAGGFNGADVYVGAPSPVANGVFVEGTPGATTYCYSATAVTDQGFSAPTTPQCTSSGNATLSATNFVFAKFEAVAGTQTMNIYKQVGGIFELICANAPNHNEGCNDTGQTPTTAQPVGGDSGILFTDGPIQQTVQSFSSLPACSSGVEGTRYPVKDSTTILWGATITGGGTNHVLAYCDGTNWTVAAI